MTAIILGHKAFRGNRNSKTAVKLTFRLCTNCSYIFNEDFYYGSMTWSFTICQISHAASGKLLWR